MFPYGSMGATDADTLVKPGPAGQTNARGVFEIADGRYTLLDRIGEGGMAEVFRARHNHLGKELAIKLLKPSFAADPRVRERFVREARALSRVAHDNVVDVTDIGETPDGSVFMAMELLEGEGLHELLAREGPLPWARTKLIALQVCRALFAAHQEGVVHRDVKPENCWRSRRGANHDFIKVLDFGIAKMHPAPGEVLEKLTETGEVFGTPAYMSPEQAAGRPADGRSDIYAVGVMLYRMATGSLPFIGNTAVIVLGKHMHEPPVPPRSLATDSTCPPALETIILRALAKDPSDRFPSMKDLAGALAQVSSNTSTNGAAAVAAARPRRAIVWWAVVVVIACALVGLFLVWTE